MCAFKDVATSKYCKMSMSWREDEKGASRMKICKCSAVYDRIGGLTPDPYLEVFLPLMARPLPCITALQLLGCMCVSGHETHCKAILCKSATLM